MSTNLIRINAVATAVAAARADMAVKADAIANNARIAAQSFPRKNNTLRNAFRRLRNMAREARRMAA